MVKSSKEERSKIMKEAAQKREKEKYDKTHKEIDGTLYKQCSCHKIYFPDENDWFPCTKEYFYINKTNNSDGLYPKCKKCDKIRAKNYNKENEEKHSKQFKEWYEKNKQHQLETNKRNIEKNKEKRLKYLAQYRKNNKDKTREYQRKRQQNKAHKINKQEWKSCLEYFNNECAYCGMTLEEHKRICKQQLHKEHVYENGRNDLKNCIPSCKLCNSMKLKNSFNDWYNPENPVYTYERYHKICQ